MSFVDDLRSGRDEEDERRKRLLHSLAYDFSKNALDLIKGSCRSAQKSGKNTVSGFVVSYDDPDTYGAYIVEFRSYELHAPQAGTRDLKVDSRSALDLKPGVTTRHLYDHTGYAYEPELAEMMIQILDKDLHDLGFSDYQVNMRQLNDPLITTQLKVGFFFGGWKETITVEDTGKTITAVEVVVRW